MLKGPAIRPLAAVVCLSPQASSIGWYPERLSRTQACSFHSPGLLLKLLLVAALAASISGDNQQFDEYQGEGCLSAQLRAIRALACRSIHR
jgi:hypothetical protein